MKKKRFNCKSDAMRRLRAAGWPLVFDVEQRLGFGHVTRDLLGCIDCLAYSPAWGWLGVQATTEANGDKHIKAAMGSLLLQYRWLCYGFRFEIWLYPGPNEREQGETEIRIVTIGQALKGPREITSSTSTFVQLNLSKNVAADQ